MIRNLHGEEKSGNMMSVYSLVEDTPTKDLGKQLENLIDDNTSLTTPNALNISPQNSATPTNPELSTNSHSPQPVASKLWADQLDDLNLSDDSTDDMEELRETFKRKFDESPGNKDFEVNLSKKEKKKLKQLLNKSS